MNSTGIAMKNTTQALNYMFSFDPFCIEWSLAAQDETNWIILQTVREMMDTMLRLKDRGATFHEELFELVAHCVLTPMVSRNKVAWGILQPVPPYLCYATPALTAILQQEGNRWYPADEQGINDLRDLLLYRFLLQKLYGWQPAAVEPAHLTLDTRFLEVSTSHELPPLAHHIIKEELKTGNSPTYLRTHLPLHRFQFEGFACIQVLQ